MTKLKPKRKPAKNPETLPPGRHGFGGNLWLSVEGNSRSWSFRYKLPGQKPRTMGLGGWPCVNLASARQAALDAKRLTRAGIDPIEHRKAAKARQSLKTDFQSVAEALIAERRAAWSSPAGERAWRASLAQYTFPTLGARDVSTISIDDVVAVLKPIWSAKRPTAERVRSRIEMVLDRAIALGLRTEANPAALKILRHVLPPASKKARVEHHAALAYVRIPSFMRALAASSSPAAPALAFTILCALRTNETLGLRWGEVSADLRLLTIPGDRMKTGAEHVVPLSGAAAAILAARPRGADDSYVFTGARGARVGIHAMRRLAQEIAPGVSVHGFRSTFRDWAGDETPFEREIAEAALAHSVGGAVERAYRRGSALEKRRTLMSAWSSFIDGEKPASLDSRRGCRMSDHETPKTDQQKPTRRGIKLIRRPLTPLDKMFQAPPQPYTPGSLKPLPQPAPKDEKA